ncbi:MAG: flippase-like domain-containing protein [Melioribacteraceae bacterium]|nr:flippase-like domain-containing protein [Melioribacteraceae bacterium]
MKFLNNKKIFSGLKIIISIGLLIFLVEYIKGKNIISVLKTADTLLVVFVILLMPLNLFIQIIKWKIIVKKFLDIDDYSKTIKSFFNGISSGILTPLFIGEYLGRGFVFKEIGYAKVSLVTFIDKIIPLLIIVFCGGVLSLYYTSLYFPQFYIYSLILALLLILAVGIALVMRKKMFNYIKRRFDKFSIIIESIFSSNRMDLKLVSKISLLSVLYIFIYTTQFSLLIMAFNQSDLSIHFFGITIVLMFAKSIIPPITIADIGIRETLSVALFSIIAVNEAAAFNAAMVLFIINILTPAVIGIPLLKDSK